MTPRKLVPGMTEGAVNLVALTTPDNEDARNGLDFIERRGRFADIDPSTPDREQVYPFPEPPVREQTHAPR